jgi:hypothetical protein
MRRRLEKSIEKACKTWAQKRGWWCAKFKSPGKRSAPDGIFVRWGFHIFVEFKAEGEEATENQELYHAEMRAVGCSVYVIDNVDAFKELFLHLEAAYDPRPQWLRD